MIRYPEYFRGGGTGIAGRVVGARGRLQPVGTETVAQHAGQVRNLVAGAEVVVPGHRFPVRVDGGSGVLGAASVVDREAVRLVAGQQIVDSQIKMNYEKIILSTDCNAGLSFLW